MKIETELLEIRQSDECGCPEEEWLVGGCNCIIHMEENGDMHVFLDAGDSDTEMMFHTIPNLEDGRDLGLGWAKAMLYSKSGWH